MDGGKTVVVREMEDNDVEDEGCVGSSNFMFGSEVDRNGIFPVLQLFIEFTDSVEEFAIRLFRGFG